eukprot:XP_017174342.1 PREDICTED: proline-rich protein 36-like isoform X2 [Mus musculus]
MCLSLSLSLCLTLSLSSSSSSSSSSLPPGAAWRRRPPSRDPSRLPRVPQPPALPSPSFSFLLLLPSSIPACLVSAVARAARVSVSVCPPVLVLPSSSILLLPSRPAWSLPWPAQLGSLCLSVPLSWFSLLLPSSIPACLVSAMARAARVSASVCPPVLVLPSPSFSLLPSPRGPSPSLHPTEMHHPGFRVSRRPPVSVCQPPFSFLLPPRDQARVRVPRSLGLSVPLSPCPGSSFFLLPSSIPACLVSAVARAARVSASVCPPVPVLPSPASFFHPGLPGLCRGPRSSGLCVCLSPCPGSPFSFLLPSRPAWSLPWPAQLGSLRLSVPLSRFFLLLLPSSIPACLVSAVARAARVSASVCPPVLVLPSPSFFHPGLPGLCRGLRSSGLCVCLSPCPGSPFSFLLPASFSPGTKPESASDRDAPSRLPCVSPSPGLCLSTSLLLPSSTQGPSPSPCPAQSGSVCPPVPLSRFFLLPASFFHPGLPGLCRGPRSSGLCVCLSPCPGSSFSCFLLPSRPAWSLPWPAQLGSLRLSVPLSWFSLLLPSPCFLLPGDQARVCIRPRCTIPASVCLAVPRSLSVSLPSPSFFHPGTKPESVSRAVWVCLSPCPPVPVLPSSCFLLPSRPAWPLPWPAQLGSLCLSVPLSPCPGSPFSFFHPGLPGLCRGPRSSGLCVCLSPCPPVLVLPSPSSIPACLVSAVARAARVSVCLSPCPGSPFSFLLPSRPAWSLPWPAQLGSLSVCPPVLVLPSPSSIPACLASAVARAARVSASVCPPVLVLPSPSFSLLPSPRGPSPSLHPTETHHPGFRVSRRPPVSVCQPPFSFLLPPRDQARVRVPRSLGLSVPLSPCPGSSFFLLPSSIPACLVSAVARAARVSASVCPPVPVLPSPASFFHPGLPGLCRGLRSSGLCVCLSPCPGSPFSFLLPASFSPGTKPESASDRDAPSRLPCVSPSPGLCLSPSLLLPSSTQGPSPSPCPAQSGSVCPTVPLSWFSLLLPSPCFLLPGDQARVCIRPRRTIPASVRLAVPGSLRLLPSSTFFHPGTKPESVSRAARVSVISLSPRLPTFSASWGRIWDPNPSPGSRREVWLCHWGPRAGGVSGLRPPLPLYL